VTAVLRRAVLRRLGPGALALAALTACTGCGGAQRPSDDDIFHDPALRPGALEGDDVDRALLARLGELPAEARLELGGRAYVAGAVYHAASGRACRQVLVSAGATSSARLACVARDATWVFVPDVFGSQEPFQPARGASVPPEEAP
jgi:hypothetical protein